MRSKRGGIEAIKIVLVVERMDRAIAFYRDAIGLDLIEESDMWSEMGWGDAVVALHAGGHAGETRETGLSIQIADLETVCSRTRQAGGVVVRPPVERPGEGIRIASVQDPEGNRISLVSRVETSRTL